MTPSTPAPYKPLLQTQLQTLQAPPVNPPSSSNQVTVLSPTNPDNSNFSNQPITITTPTPTPTGTTLTCASTTTETNLSQSDPTYQYPLGLTNFCFNTTNPNNQVSLSFITNLKPNQVVARKYNSTTKTYANLPTSANPTITETTINGKHALVLTYTIVDNGPLDLDNTTGKIKDPIGLAMTNTSYNNLLDSLADTGTNTKLLTTAALSLTILALVGMISIRQSIKHESRA